MTPRTFLAPLALLLLPALSILAQAPAPDPAQELLRLETVWNEAHVKGDVEALDRLWADDLSILVPKMPAMSKADVLSMWRKVPVRIRRYESSEVAVRVYGESAVVTGQIVRERDFGGKVAEEHWLFTKVYVRQGGAWKVVAFQASEAPE